MHASDKQGKEQVKVGPCWYRDRYLVVSMYPTDDMMKDGHFLKKKSGGKVKPLEQGKGHPKREASCPALKQVSVPISW